MRVHIPEAHALDPAAYVARTYASEIVGSTHLLSKMVYEHSSLPLRVFEAARAMTAQINGCQICQQWRSARDASPYVKSMGGKGESMAMLTGPVPDEDFYDAIADWKTSPLFDRRERLAIELAEGMGLRPKVLADDQDFWSRMLAAFSDNEIVDICFCIGSWIGFGRTVHVLGLDGVCQMTPPQRVPEPSPS